MKKYKMYHSNRFERELRKFDSFFIELVDKIEDKLTEDPYTGSPLGVRWFREKRIGKYRIYYLIYEQFLQSVFMIAISEKKDQQKVINAIKLTLNILKEEVENIIDKEDSI